MVQLSCPAFAPGMVVPAFMRLMTVGAVRRLMSIMPPTPAMGKDIRVPMLVPRAPQGGEQLTSLYVWLRFFHLLGLAAFLFGHGISGGAAFALRSSTGAENQRLLQLSQKSLAVAYPGLLLLIVTGVWMAFAGHWWGHGWLWASLVVLVVLFGAMGYIARPYYLARAAASQTEDVARTHLSRAKPIAAAWIGGVGLVALIGLMVFKPF